jgi:phosphoribosyl-dephospho-CoA transferase
MTGAEVPAGFLHRHYLVWVDPSGWQRHLLEELPATQLPVVQEWFGQRRPAVVCRQEAAKPGGVIRLGIPLSPRRGRSRIALTIGSGALCDVRPPPLLTRVTRDAPPAWQAPLRHLAAAAAALQLSLRVYGSFLWQHLTGETYVTERSDVDLLFAARDDTQLQSMLALLLQWERESGLRADGELLLADGAGVAWRELLRADGTVLAKRTTAVQLLARADIARRLCEAGA